MTESFDAYYKWLGIPPEEQPPDHYRLLGVRPFEDNEEVIRASADRQLVHLGTYKSGAHAELAQTLIKEVVSARECLMEPDRRAKYDQHLRAQFESRRPDDPQATFVDPKPPAPPEQPEPPLVVDDPERAKAGRDETADTPSDQQSSGETSISTNVALHKLFDATEQKGKRHKEPSVGDGADHTAQGRDATAMPEEIGGQGQVRGHETRSRQSEPRARQPGSCEKQATELDKSNGKTGLFEKGEFLSLPALAVWLLHYCCSFPLSYWAEIPNRAH